MVDNKINVLVFNISLIEGMAGSMRVRNLLEPLIASNKITVNNLVVTSDTEIGKIGNAGKEREIAYLYIGFSSLRNISSLIKYYRSGFSFIRNCFAKSRTNIMYNYGYPDAKIVPFVFIAKLLGYKIVFDIVEDNRYHPDFKNFLTWLRIKSSLFLIRHVSFYSDAVLTISNHLKNRMMSISKGRANVHFIPVVVDFRFFREPNYALTHPYNIFYGGSFGKKDGLKFLLQAFNLLIKEYPDLRLTLTGRSNYKPDMDAVRPLIESNQNIDYLGYLTTEEYYRALNAASIFCMTRNNSDFANAGFPFKLGEFLATGKGVIATNVGDVSLYIKDRVNGLLIAPESVEDIVQGIRYYIENPDQIRALGTEARKTAVENFDSVRLSNALFDVFKSFRT